MSHNTDYELLRDMFTTEPDDTKFRLVLSVMRHAGRTTLFPVLPELTKEYNEGPNGDTNASIYLLKFQLDAASAAAEFNAAANADKRQALQDAVAAIDNNSSATKQWLKTIYGILVGPNIRRGTGQIDQRGFNYFMGMRTPITARPHSTYLSFPFQNNKHIWQRMLESIATSTGSASGDNYWLPSSQVKSKDGKLVDQSGNDVSVQSPANRIAFETATTDASKCKLYGFNKNPISRTNCVHLVTECLSGNNISQCKRYLTDNTFWGSVERDIKGTQIGNIKNALDKFGFNVVNVDGSNVYESPAEWAKHALNGTGFDDTDRASITGNTQLMTVLSGMVAAINNNPGVLNVEGTKAPVPSTFRATTLAAYGVLPRILVGGGAHEDQIRLTNAYKQLNAQVGGGLGMQDGRVVVTPERLHRDQVTSHDALVAQFRAYSTLLSNKGKIIHSEDVEKIQNLLADLKNAEEKLNKVNLILSKFNMLYDIDSSIYTKGTFNVQDVEKLVKKHEKLLEKKERKQKYVLAVLNGVAGAIVGDDN